MEYRAFQFGVDDRYIKAIHDGTAATGLRVDVSEMWFRLRFEQNPLGKAVLACAFDGDRLVSCVAVERMPIQCDGKTSVGGCTHVLFVQEGYDTQDMWVGLLKVLEEDCEHQGIDLVVGFNDQNLITSAQGFGWMYYQGMIRYRLNSVTGMWRNIFKMLDMRKPFVVDDKAEGVQNEGVDDVCIPDYFKWLILTSLKRFVVVDKEEVCAVKVIGHRGKRVKEAQICYFEPKKSLGAAQRSLVGYIKGHFTKEEIDVVSCVDGKNYLSKRNSIRTTQEVNYCYKCLGESIDFQIGEITQMEILFP
jgi:hypothetical protein